MTDDTPARIIPRTPEIRSSGWANYDPDEDTEHLTPTAPH